MWNYLLPFLVGSGLATIMFSIALTVSELASEFIRITFSTREAHKRLDETLQAERDATSRLEKLTSGK
ncbi:hypothetical protein [Schaalia suimastitidis]|uniref:hypothetical protein n=1 Tax=Schaalia suimastitidis TaxID=121163 RepID=UPI0004223ABC|nr:hypothetical protein [Schaalia suimastitidis]